MSTNRENEFSRLIQNAILAGVSGFRVLYDLCKLYSIF